MCVDFQRQNWKKYAPSWKKNLHRVNFNRVVYFQKVAVCVYLVEDTHTLFHFIKAWKYVTNQNIVVPSHFAVLQWHRAYIKWVRAAIFCPVNSVECPKKYAIAINSKAVNDTGLQFFTCKMPLRAQKWVPGVVCSTVGVTVCPLMRRARCFTMP